MSRELRPYQVTAVSSVHQAWTIFRSTLLVLATGTGKTFTAASILRDRAPVGRILWVAHRRELITQAKDAIESVGLATDIEMAQDWAPLRGGLFGSSVVIASVQSLQGTRLRRFDHDAFATIVIDEAHHATAQSYRDILDWFPNAKVLGLTATPDRGDGVGLKAVFEREAFGYGIREAIREGYLSPIVQRTIECADLDLSDVKTVAGDLAQGALEKAMTLDAVLHQVAKPLVDSAGDRSTIVFTAGVEQAHAMVDVMAGYTDAKCAAIDGTTPDDIRARRLASFARGELQYLFNCAVLTEGFDAPRTSCIAVARPTKSRALYTQMIGRGTRLFAGKTDCLATGSRVLTDHGLVEIQHVTRSMRVWDGVEYVDHHGVVYKGERDVIQYAGLWATPDHKVWTSEGWQAFGECAVKQTPVRVTGDGGSAVREADCRERTGEQGSWHGSSDDEVHGLRCRQTPRLHERHSKDGGLSHVRSTASGSEVALESMLAGAAEVHEPACVCVCSVRGAGDSVPISYPAGHGAMDHGESGSEQGDGDRSHRQRRPLRAGKSSSHIRECTGVQHAQAPEYTCYAQVPDGASGDSICGFHSDEAYRSRHDVRGDREAVPRAVAQAQRGVWDILNAGPRNRFTVEGLLVSNCLVLDFVGNAGRHTLISPLDVLAGKPLKDDVREAAEAKVKAGMPSEDALAAAEAEHEAREKRAEQERARAAKIRADVAYRSRVVDPFGALGQDTGNGPRATSRQVEALTNLGVKGADTLSVGAASKLLDTIAQRRKAGLATYKQSAQLMKHGLSPDLTFAEARLAMDALAANRWTCTPEMRARWGGQQAAE